MVGPTENGDVNTDGVGGAGAYHASRFRREPPLLYFSRVEKKKKQARGNYSFVSFYSSISLFSGFFFFAANHRAGESRALRHNIYTWRKKSPWTLPLISFKNSIHDYMFEESVCLLIRATWFVPLPLEAQEEASYEQEAIYQYEDEEDDDLDDEAYFGSSSSLRIGNRRWGDNGYIRAGRREARPVHQERFQEASAGSSGGQRNKEPSKDVMGRRAKRAMKRDAADKAAAAKHQQHLQRLGRK
ncbi:uncharacterized protein LOC131251242 isoform X2 [Magnolia sinica]|uniref:uncharacterized protein LOC131251242 isoform X2 n=1 Tax=Magnolia sinica TaxID=86752 RepID=UPI00265971B3|nr:uncharacterized protein LOC131251242 isoform X2 [Magnolia sinica]